jgi:hypothetical protein
MACWAKDGLSFEPDYVGAADLIYLAGLFDGEGCVQVCGHRRAGLALAMNDEPTIAWLHERFGGTVSRQKKQHRWELNRVADLSWVLPRLIPYSRLKRPRLEAALKLVAFTTLRPGLKNAQLDEWNRRLPSMAAPLKAGYYDTEQR